MSALYFVFDVESVGLHGDAWAFGYTVVDQDGVEQESGKAACWLDNADGLVDDRMWVRENCSDAVESKDPVAKVPACTNPGELRAVFWAVWTRWSTKGAVMVADCSWPVEARFLAKCIDVYPIARRWLGPYPLHDVATARLCAGLDPLATVPRLPTEQPKHDPLADARQSARLWLEALNLIRKGLHRRANGNAMTAAWRARNLDAARATNKEAARRYRARKKEGSA